MESVVDRKDPFVLEFWSGRDAPLRRIVSTMEG